MNITSPDNAVVKDICRLQESSKFRKERGLFVAEGLRLCRDAVDASETDICIMTEAFSKQHKADSDYFAEKSNKCISVSDRVMKKMSGTVSPQGIVCVCKIPKIPFEVKKSGKYIALENMSDPSNLGAVARTAEALGIDGIIVSGNGCDRCNPKALRASMGALVRLPVIELCDFANEIKKFGLPLYGCVIDADADDIRNADFSKGGIAVIGNEANGLTEQTKSISRKVTIRMFGPTESFNAATAAAIVMWEMVR